MPMNRREIYANGIREMYEPFERVAREHHICPCCERGFTPDEEDEFIEKQRTKGAHTADGAKKLAIESANAENFVQQLKKLNTIYEDYVKLRDESIPLAEKNLNLLLADESQKSQMFRDLVGVLAKVKMDRDAVEVLLQTSDTIDRHLHEIQQLEEEVKDLEYKLDSSGQGSKSLDEIQLELNTLQRTRDTLNIEGMILGISREC